VSVDSEYVGFGGTGSSLSEVINSCGLEREGNQEDKKAMIRAQLHCYRPGPVRPEGGPLGVIATSVSTFGTCLDSS